VRIDLLTLKLYVAVFEEQSLVKAAERENLAASAVSRRLADLEHALKVKLFVRKHAGMYPTPAGQALLHHARTILHGVERLENELGDYASGVRGSIRVFANTSAMVQYLSGDLSSFLLRHPLVRVEMEEVISPVALRGVAENNADIGIYGDVIAAPGLHSMLYREDRLIVLVPRGHPLAKRGAARFADVLAYDLVGSPKGSSIDTAMIEAANEHGVPLTLRIRASGFDAISRMVDAGMGIALIPELAAQHYVVTLGVETVALDEPWATRRLMMCVRSMESLSPAAAAFVKHLMARQPATTKALV